MSNRPVYEFDRYINGVLMAEGVTIERQINIPDAAREAVRIASKGPNGESPVLVLSASIPADIGELVRQMEHDAEHLYETRPWPDTYKKAASALLSLSARVGELEKALEPFAVRAGLLDGKWQDHETHWSPAYGSTEVTIGDLRRARRVYERGNGNV